MKKLFLIAIAALFLATGAAHAADDDDYEQYQAAARARGDMTDKFYLHLHACDIVLRTDLGVNTLELADLVALQKLIPTLRACDTFYKCVAKRDWRRYTPNAEPKGPIPKHCSWPTRILGPEGSR